MPRPTHILATCATALLAKGALAGMTLEVSAIDRGVYLNDGFQDTSNNAFATGNLSAPPREARSWMAFDLSEVDAEVISVELVVFHRFLGSVDDSETVEFREVTTAFDVLSTSGVSISAFDDLADGPLFASLEINQRTPEFDFISIPLNSNSIDAINDTRLFAGPWAVGLSVSTLDDDPLTDELVFPIGKHSR
ncbi:MAG: hypothetical protein AAF432_12815 [Planctomycetota bacterium]